MINTKTLVLLLSILVVGCYQPATYEKDFSCFNDSLTLHQIEKTDDFGRTLSIEYKFLFSKPGKYHIEGWAKRSRDTDVKVIEWDYDITNVPHVKNESINTYIYRIELVKAADGDLVTDQIYTYHHGTCWRNRCLRSE